MVILKQLFVSNPLSRFAVRFHPMVATDVFNGLLPTSRRMLHEEKMIHEESQAELFKTEDAKNLYVSIRMPGVKKEDVEASCKLTGFNSLKVKGGGAKIDGEHIEYRTLFDLRRNIKTSGTVAVMNDGELKVNFPKLKNREERMEKFDVKICKNIINKAKC